MQLSGFCLICFSPLLLFGHVQIFRPVHFRQLTQLTKLIYIHPIYWWTMLLPSLANYRSEKKKSAVGGLQKTPRNRCFGGDDTATTWHVDRKSQLYCVYTSSHKAPSIQLWETKTRKKCIMIIWGLVSKLFNVNTKKRRKKDANISSLGAPFIERLLLGTHEAWLISFTVQGHTVRTS